jgi:hypothetical protein
MSKFHSEYLSWVVIFGLVDVFFEGAGFAGGGVGNRADSSTSSDAV